MLSPAGWLAGHRVDEARKNYSGLFTSKAISCRCLPILVTILQMTKLKPWPAVGHCPFDVMIISSNDRYLVGHASSVPR